MSVIWKYVFGDETEIKIEWPEGSRVLLVAPQRCSDYTPVVWIAHPKIPRDSDPIRAFNLIGTGHAYEERDGYEHVGSAVCADGRLVWHVFSGVDSG